MHNYVITCLVPRRLKFGRKRDCKAIKEYRAMGTLQSLSIFHCESARTRLGTGQCNHQHMFFSGKDDVTRDDSQRRFLAQHSVAALLRHCFEHFQHCSNIEPLECSSLRIVSCNTTLKRSLYIHDTSLCTHSFFPNVLHRVGDSGTDN